MEGPTTAAFAAICGCAHETLADLPCFLFARVQERLLFNCPQGTQRFMNQNKLKLSNKV